MVHLYGHMQPISFSCHFHTFKEGGPSANAGLQGALHLHYNISNTQQKNIYIK